MTPHPSNDNRPAEFDRALLTNRRGLHAYALRRYGDAAEDLVHDTLINAMCRWRAFRPSGSMYWWLVNLLRSTKYSQDNLRRAIRFSGDEIPEIPQAPSQEYAVDASMTLSWCTPQARTLLTMAAQEFTFEEIGAEFGVSKQRAQQMVVREQSALRANAARADTRMALAAHGMAA